jgi:hypothetical protein
MREQIDDTETDEEPGAHRRAARPSIRANDTRPNTITRYGGYLCLDTTRTPGRVAGAAVSALIERLDLQNEFEDGHASAARTIAFLRRVSVIPADIADDRLLHASAVVHLSSDAPAPLTEFRAELTRLLGLATPPAMLAGVVRPLNYTGNAMHNFAYAHRVIQQSGTLMPEAFLVPLIKVAAWWEKPWMERHTFFLPRYDASGRMISEGHALAASAGIPCLMRRTYRNLSEPAPEGEYDFINYFECADSDVRTFHDVCAALRDTRKNPEWTFVREGPTWHGRRVATWDELFG